MKPSSLLGRALVGSALVATTCASAPAFAAHGDVWSDVSQFQIQLIDLNAGDGIAPSIMFDSDNASGWASVNNASVPLTGYDSVFTPAAHGGASASQSDSGAQSRVWFSAPSQYGAWQVSHTDRTANFVLSPFTALLVTGRATLHVDQDGLTDAYSTVSLSTSLSDPSPDVQGGPFQFQSYSVTSGEHSYRLSAYLTSGELAQEGSFILTTSATLKDPGLPSTPVPEPEAWAMLVAGLGIAGAAARRRRAPG